MSASRNRSSVGAPSPGPRSTTIQSAGSSWSWRAIAATCSAVGFAEPGGSLTPPIRRTFGTWVATARSASGVSPNASDRLRDGRGTPAKMWRFGAPNAASTRITRLPSVARKIPTFAATRLLPTPPLPPAMATTLPGDPVTPAT